MSSTSVLAAGLVLCLGDAPPNPSVSIFNPVFDSPSLDGPADNMPVGNGEVVANVWVDAFQDGSLGILLGRSDVFSPDVQPLKLGRVRLTLDPNPFTISGGSCTNGTYTKYDSLIGDQKSFVVPDFPCTSQDTCQAEATAKCNSMDDCQSFAIDPGWEGPHDAAAAQLYSTGKDNATYNTEWTLWARPCGPPIPFKFKQELDIETGSITISTENVSIRIWSDINSLAVTDSVHIEVSSVVPTSVTAFIDPWRIQPFNQTTKSTARGPCEPTIVVDPDSIVDNPVNGSLTWYRFNNRSSFNKTMSDQMLGTLASKMQDPLLGRASGATVIGTNFNSINSTHIKSGMSTQHTVTVVTHTGVGFNSSNDFLKELSTRSAERKNVTIAWNAHALWWEDFWGRSWINLTATDNRSDTAAVLSQTYTLNRYITAIQSRGEMAIHHNGGSLTWGWDGSSHTNPDARGWGGGYWFQNVRHSYWYTLLAGDYDLLDPLFGMYSRQLPVLEERSKQWWHHDGAQFGETTYFFGTYEPCDYGCGRSGVPDLTNPYIKHHYEGGVELAVMMLNAYQHTRNETLLKNTVLPWCESILTFYDMHYPKYTNGTLNLLNAQSCETWPTCTNPAPQVSALHRISQALVALPAEMVTQQQQSFFARIAAHLPRIPLTYSDDRELQISPCEGGFPSHHVNSENTETYAIWPYEFFSVNRSETEYPLAVGQATFSNVHFGHGNSAWRYDGMDAALLGIADQAWYYSASRIMDQGRTEGSRFPAYLSKDPSDGAPEVESNGIASLTLQKMLLQTDGRRILVFPAFLKGIDVDAQLHVPGYDNAEPAVIRIVSKNNDIVYLNVTPSTRAPDVVVLELQ